MRTINLDREILFARNHALFAAAQAIVDAALVHGESFESVHESILPLVAINYNKRLHKIYDMAYFPIEQINNTETLLNELDVAINAKDKQRILALYECAKQFDWYDEPKQIANRYDKCIDRANDVLYS